MLNKKETTIIHPMLVSIYGYKKTVQDSNSLVVRDELVFPQYSQYKLDGLRCVYINGLLYSRG